LALLIADVYALCCKLLFCWPLTAPPTPLASPPKLFNIWFQFMLEPLVSVVAMPFPVLPAAMLGEFDDKFCFK
jgi:hypothetical protein